MMCQFAVDTVQFMLTTDTRYWQLRSVSLSCVSV